MLVTGSGNVATYTFDNSDGVHSLLAFAGSTRNFQYWYRDSAAGGANFNLSDGLSVELLP